MKTGSRVKFISGGEMHYGILLGKPEEIQVSLLEEVEIADAIRPERWILEGRYVSEVPTSNGEGICEYEAYLQNRLASAVQRSNAVKGCKPGKLLRFPHADAWCFYELVRTTPRVVRLEWRGYDPARVVHPDYGWECTMSRSDCLRYIEVDSYLNSLLAWTPK